MNPRIMKLSTKYYKLFVLIFIAIVIFSCEQKNELPAGLVAQVDDSYLVKKQLEYRVPAQISGDVAFSMKRMMIKQWVENEIIYQSAIKEGLKLNEEEQFQIDSYKKSLLVEKYLNNKLNKNYLVSDKEIEDLYNSTKKEFVRVADEVHIIHLNIENRDNAIFNEIRESSDLKEIISKYYFDTRSTMEKPNGDMGYVVLETLPDFMQKEIKRLKTGSISRPIKSDQGYHFIQLIDKQKAGTQIDLDLVKDELVRRIKWNKRQQESKRLASELKDKFQVQTYLSKVQ
jgi:parvulin-like peptidyl-prolyl isomerase